MYFNVFTLSLNLPTKLLLLNNVYPISFMIYGTKPLYLAQNFTNPKLKFVPMVTERFFSMEVLVLSRTVYTALEVRGAASGIF